MKNTKGNEKKGMKAKTATTPAAKKAKAKAATPRQVKVEIVDDKAATPTAQGRGWKLVGGSIVAEPGKYEPGEVAQMLIALEGGDARKAEEEVAKLEWREDAEKRFPTLSTRGTWKEIWDRALELSQMAEAVRKKYWQKKINGLGDVLANNLYDQSARCLSDQLYAVSTLARHLCLFELEDTPKFRKAVRKAMSEAKKGGAK